MLRIENVKLNGEILEDIAKIENEINHRHNPKSVNLYKKAIHPDSLILRIRREQEHIGHLIVRGIDKYAYKLIKEGMLGTPKSLYPKTFKNRKHSEKLLITLTVKKMNPDEKLRIQKHLLEMLEPYMEDELKGKNIIIVTDKALEETLSTLDFKKGIQLTKKNHAFEHKGLQC